MVSIQMFSWSIEKFINKTNNKWNGEQFFLANSKFMPEMYLKQPRVTYSACGLLKKQKNIERIEKSEKTEDFKFIYHNELDKACF